MVNTQSFFKQAFLFLFLVFSGCDYLLNSPQEKITIGFSQGLWNHPFRTLMNETIQVEASIHENVTLITEITNEVENEQIKHIQSFIDQEVDVIIVSAVNEVALVDVISKAKSKNIPVILLDRKISSNDYTTYIGADNIQIGRTAANRIISSGKKGLNVIQFYVGDNASPSVERRLGFKQVIEDNTNTKLVAEFEYRDLKGFSEYLKNNADETIHYAFAFNDFIAYQAWQIAREMGREDEIKFIGVDGLNSPDGGIDLVKQKVLDASILYPTGGNEAIKTALDIIRNKQVNKYIPLETTVIDLSNAEIMENQFSKITNQQKVIENQSIAIKKQISRFESQQNLLITSGILSFLLLLLLGYSLNSFFVIRRTNRVLALNNKRITTQRNQLKKNEIIIRENNETKFNFFTGLSHEFKTPLTLIISSIETLVEQNSSLTKKWINELELIFNNSNRLLRLINQLLDFRKIEDRKFYLKASKTNLNHFSKSIINDFKREAKKKNIQFNFETNNEELEVFLDRNLMDKVYSNLLSNAIKFTPNNGSIKVEIKDSEESNHVLIEFYDDGIGIPEKELGQLFKPFFKGTNNRKKSSGIGLFLTKQFVELHKGNITVESNKGTKFSVHLYKGNSHLDEDEIIYQPDDLKSNTLNFDLEEIIYEEVIEDTSQSSNPEKYSVLIIEDNIDLMSFLSLKLSNKYNVYTSNGADVIQEVFELIPDFIICDVNLPEKSGFDICTILKNDIKTSHIPIILLTALGDNESYKKGMQSGADLYLKKPFSYSILSQSIKSLLYNREKLRYYFTNNIYRIEHKNSLENFDENFIIQLNQIIRENFENSSFTVEQLAKQLHISRVQLYRKVKAVLGMNVSDYINNFKLENAKAQLENTKMTVSQIAYANGFSSPNYFSTTFKNKFGTSPGAYRKK